MAPSPYTLSKWGVQGAGGCRMGAARLMLAIVVCVADDVFQS